jgi:hypothetical protein
MSWLSVGLRFSAQAEVNKRTIGQGGLGNGISVVTKLEKWQHDLWVKSKTREQVGFLLLQEFKRGNMTKSEFQEALKKVYTSLR